MVTGLSLAAILWTRLVLSPSPTVPRPPSHHAMRARARVPPSPSFVVNIPHYYRTPCKTRYKLQFFMRDDAKDMENIRFTGKYRFMLLDFTDGTRRKTTFRWTAWKCIRKTEIVVRQPFWLLTEILPRMPGDGFPIALYLRNYGDRADRATMLVSTCISHLTILMFSTDFNRTIPWNIRENESNDTIHSIIHLKIHFGTL